MSVSVLIACGFVDGLVEGLLVDFEVPSVWTVVEYAVGFGTAVVFIVDLAVDELIVVGLFISPTGIVELLSEYDCVLGFEEAVFGIKVDDLLEVINDVADKVVVVKKDV